MIARVIAFACLLSLSLPHVAAAQEPVKPPLNPRIITATRQVTMFSGIEKQMLEAVQKKDKPALQAMLNDECFIHLPDSDPLPCDDWMDSVMSRDFALKSFLIRQVTVEDLGTAAVVSYDRVLESTFKGQNDGGESYVVDLWKQEGDTWKLADRYVSKLSSKPFMPKVVKPTGKQ